MKALAAEMVRNFGQRLSALGITVQELTGDMQLSKSEIMKTQVLRFLAAFLMFPRQDNYHFSLDTFLTLLVWYQLKFGQVTQIYSMNIKGARSKVRRSL